MHGVANFKLINNTSIIVITWVWNVITSKERNPSWETNICVLRRETPGTLGTLQFHCSAHNSLSAVAIPSNPNLVYTLLIASLILASRPKFSKNAFTFRFSHQNPIRNPLTSLMCYKTLPSPNPLLERPCNIWRLSWSSASFPPNIFLSTMFSNTLSTWFILRFRGSLRIYK